MLEAMSIDEILEMKAQIAAVDGVSMVMWLDDVADVRAPLSTLDASVVQSYYNDGAALLTVQFADSDYSERTRAAVQEIDRLTGDNAMTGSAVTAGLLIQSSAEEVLLVVLWAIPVVLIILLFDVPVFSSHVTHSQAENSAHCRKTFVTTSPSSRRQHTTVSAPFSRVSRRMGHSVRAFPPYCRENRFCSQDMDICIASL